MSTNIDLQAIRKELPHGSILAISKRAEVTTSTVSRALRGDKTSPKLPNIINATVEVYGEFRAKMNEAERAFNELMKEGKAQKTQKKASKV